MILYPYAKINLGLDILRRRPDGYHDIATLFLPTDWRDVLEILPANEGLTEPTLTVTGRAVDCPTEKNLVMKAFRALEKEAGIDPVRIHLHKIIPDGAGLGGGSADAAMTLMGLDEMFGLGLGDRRLGEIAATIGADCPYFIRGGAMMAQGTGTELSSLDLSTMAEPLSRYSLVIVKPPVSMPTREAYAGVKPHIPAMPLESRLRLPVEEWQSAIVNDFEESVGSQLPEVMGIKRRMIETGAVYASMSGSGTAVYALTDSDILADEIGRMFPGCLTHTGRINL